MGAPRKLGARCRDLLRQFSANQAGAAAIEFGFGAVILFGVSIGMIDIGRYMFTANSIESAAKEGSRYAIVHRPNGTNPKSTSDMETFIKDNATGIDVSAMNVNINWEDPVTYAPGTSVTVTVTQPFNFMYSGAFDTTSFNLTAQSVYTIGR